MTVRGMSVQALAAEISDAIVRDAANTVRGTPVGCFGIAMTGLINKIVDEYLKPIEPQKYDDTLVPFVALMRAELHANSEKGDRPGWLAMDTNTALFEIYYHMAKLTYAIRKEDAAGAKEFAADVANMCMMLLDTTGLLGVPK